MRFPRRSRLCLLVHSISASPKEENDLGNGCVGVGPRVLVVSHGLTFINRNSEAVAAGFWLLK